MSSLSGHVEFGRLSVLMPIYNEARTLRQIVSRVLAVRLNMEIELICVDDCSTDESWNVLNELSEKEPRIRAFRHDRNRGKGAAVQTAIRHMTGDVAVVQDADLEYDPSDLPRLLAPILDGRADAVFGSRFTASPERRVLLYWHSLGNRFLTLLANVLNDLNLSDMETCYKAVSAEVLRDLRLSSNRFGFEPEITTRLAQWGARIYEVPISYHGRGYFEGKKIGWRDGIQAIFLLLRLRFIDTRFSKRDSQDAFETALTPASVSRWTLEQMSGAIGSTVLEAGCGIGNLTRLLLDRARLVAVDNDPYYVRTLDRRWGHLENVEIAHHDIETAEFGKTYEEAFDSVLSVNVLEHLDRPQLALDNMAQALKQGGKLALLVPGHRWLFSDVDRRIGHRCRFEYSTIVELVEEAGLHVLEARQFNRLAVAGWIFNKAFGSKRLRSWQMRVFGLALPVAKLVERLTPLPGLSWIVIAQKQ
jgi:SAM-dependent methyltransferase